MSTTHETYDDAVHAGILFFHASKPVTMYDYALQRRVPNKGFDELHHLIRCTSIELFWMVMLEELYDEPLYVRRA